MAAAGERTIAHSRASHLIPVRVLRLFDDGLIRTEAETVK
jgi:hypothetical protein